MYEWTSLPITILFADFQVITEPDIVLLVSMIADSEIRYQKRKK